MVVANPAQIVGDAGVMVMLGFEYKIFTEEVEAQGAVVPVNV